MHFQRALFFGVILSISCELIGRRALATPPVDVPVESIRTALPPTVRDVKFDSAAHPIFELASNDDPRVPVEDVYAGKSNAVAGAKILLIDHRHRIWIRPDSDKDQTTVQMYDGHAWLTRQVSDIPADSNRQLAGIHFVGGGVEDAMGNVWFVDGDRTQGWWLHQFSPDGKWTVTVLHERALLGAKGPKKADQRVLDFAEPNLQVGPDRLFYASWFSNRVDGGSGLGASGFQQFGSTGWTTYFYPTGSGKIDNVQSVIPLPDGSVGFVRLIDEPRVVWMTSALSRPVPDLDPYLERLSSLSSRDRESAQADLIAMGPRVRKPLEDFAEQSDDPEIKSRVPAILQEISKPPQRGVYGGKFTFTSWRFLHQAASGRVYLAVQGCKDLSSKASFKDAMITVSPEGVWTAAESPAKRYGQPSSALAVFEDPLGRRWYKIAKIGVLLDDGKPKPRKIADEMDADATIRGADTSGRLYLLGKDGVIVLDPSAPPPATTTSTTPTTLP
ncbi:hypothetical protein BH10PLA1_BH10PLA1_19290 [soil metagenome]